MEEDRDQEDKEETLMHDMQNGEDTIAGHYQSVACDDYDEENDPQDNQNGSDALPSELCNQVSG